MLGMPLQRQREGRRIGDAESLDLTVLGDGLETGARRQAIDALLRFPAIAAAITVLSAVEYVTRFSSSLSEGPSQPPR